MELGVPGLRNKRVPSQVRPHLSDGWQDGYVSHDCGIHSTRGPILTTIRRVSLTSMTSDQQLNHVEETQQTMAERGRSGHNALPETPHELPYDRAKIDALLERVRKGERITLIDELLAAVDWRSGFGGENGEPIDVEGIARLLEYYREKFADIGPIYIAELLSTEFMTELRARGDVEFSPKLKELGRSDPELWKEIRLFFRRKEFATAMLIHAHNERQPDTDG